MSVSSSLSGPRRQPPKKERWLSVPAAADLLDTPVSTIRRWCAAVEKRQPCRPLPGAYKHGGRWRIPEKDVHQLLRAPLAARVASTTSTAPDDTPDRQETAA